MPDIPFGADMRSHVRARAARSQAGRRPPRSGCLDGDAPTRAIIGESVGSPVSLSLKTHEVADRRDDYGLCAPLPLWCVALCC